MRRRPCTGWGASDVRLLAGSAYAVRDRIGNPIALAGRQPVRRDRQLGVEEGALRAAEEGWIAEDYDEDSKEWITRPGAERLAAALTRSGEYRMLPCFGWMILIVRDHKNERHDEKRN